MSLNNVRAVGDDRPWKDEVERELSQIWDVLKYGKITLRASTAGGGGGGGSTGPGLDSITATLPATYNSTTYTIGVDQDAFDHIANLGYAQFDTTVATGTYNDVGLLTWNDTDGTLEFGLKGGLVTLQIGQEQVVRVRNNTGSTLTEGTVCYFSGSDGVNFNVVPARADADATSAQTMGVLTETLNTSSTQHGFLTTFGLVRNIDLSYIAGLTAGDQLYLDGATAGRMTRTKPSAPTHLVYVGICLSANGGGTNSTIFVKVQNGYELDEIHDVKITGPIANNEVLAYTSSTSLWENKTAAEANLATVSDLSGYAALASANTFTTGAQTILTGADANKGLIVKGNSATQSANLFEVQDSGGVVRTSISANASNFTTSGINSSYLYGHSNRAFINNTATTLSMPMIATANSAIYVPFAFKGATSQTADLSRWVDSANTTLAKVDATGNLTAASIIKTGGTSAQFLKADGSVDSSTYITGITGISAGGDLTGTYPNPTIKADVQLKNPVLSPISTVGGGGSEGGQINFGRVTDGATYWYIDSYGSTSTPDLRFISGTNNYFQFNANGSIQINGSTGTSGQVLQSTGASTPPQWATVSGTSSNSFTTINAPAGTDPVATSSTDTLNLANGTGISISGDSGTKTVTFGLANTAVTAGSYGSSSSVGTFTVDAQGRLTAASNTSIGITQSQVTNLTTDLAAKAATSTVGLIGIVPTSVAVGSGSGSAASDGLVTFTSASSVSLNGVFSSTYRNYEVVLNVSTVNTSNANLTLRMRASGVDNSTAGSYLMAMNGINTSGTAASIATTGTQATFSYGSPGYQAIGASFTVMNPFLAVPTKMLVTTSGTDTAYTNFTGRSGAIAHSQSASYDGITFLLAGGGTSITGTVKVYGYN